MPYEVITCLCLYPTNVKAITYSVYVHVRELKLQYTINRSRHEQDNDTNSTDDGYIKVHLLCSSFLHIWEYNFQNLEHV